jgi:phosphoribosylamine--glycine ligase
MKVLVIGGGGREHALVWKLRESPHVEKIFCAPGNGGMQMEGQAGGRPSVECYALTAADASEVGAIVALAERLKPDLTVVGPEAPLVAGVADEFEKRGWILAGPGKKGAQLEGSKIFAKDFLTRHNIPTANVYGVHDSPGDAYSALCSVDWPMVIKADGLCGGKGVLVTASPDEATSFVERLMDKREFGSAGERVLMEEALEGEELSYIVLTDGMHVAPLAAARDHKRAFDGNAGPNTGGMGAYSTEELLPEGLEKIILETIGWPVIRGLQKDGTDYRGFLYFGLMLTAEGPKVLEFNCRMGDPEAQALAARIDFDLAEVLDYTARGKLEPKKVKWKPDAGVCVVMASRGYPGNYESGKKIEGIAEAETITGVRVLHAGTQRNDGSLMTSGGRVLGVTAVGPTLAAASEKAYRAAGKIHFEGAHYRKDIGATVQSRVAGD